ncbi:MAG: hypothetical protein IPN96_08650 [Anaerolineales bacterium]|nr:hypothetical protein [Anaerolineales bacterium]
MSQPVYFQAIPLAFFSGSDYRATFLLILWLVVASNTLIGVWHGSIFAPCTRKTLI